MVILGKQSIDNDNNQTGQMLAALTGMPQGTFASEVGVQGDKVNVTREVDGGLMTVAALNLPAVITTDFAIERTRYASLPNIMKAKKKPLETITTADLGVDGHHLSIVKVVNPPQRQAGVKVGSVAELVDKLKNEAKVNLTMSIWSLQITIMRPSRVATLNVIAAAKQIGGTSMCS